MASSYTEYFQLNQWAAEAEENRTALEAAEQAWRDQNALHLLKTATPVSYTHLAHQ